MLPPVRCTPARLPSAACPCMDCTTVSSRVLRSDRREDASEDIETELSLRPPTLPPAPGPQLPRSQAAHQAEGRELPRQDLLQPHHSVSPQLAHIRLNETLGSVETGAADRGGSSPSPSSSLPSFSPWSLPLLLLLLRQERRLQTRFPQVCLQQDFHGDLSFASSFSSSHPLVALPVFLCTPSK